MAELTRAVQAGVGHIVLDSLSEIDRLAQVVRELGADPAPVLLRVTVGVEAHTHEFIATAHEDQKFGLSLAAGAAREAMERLLATPELDFHGLHSHIGSQIFDTAGFEVAAARVVQFASEIVHDLGATVPVLNLGGGMGIAYVGGDDPVSPTHMAQSLRDIIRRECTQHNLPLPQLMVEPGRAIIGPGMLTLYRVGTVKDVVLGAQEQRRYLSVDGGMSDNIRTALYDAVYTSTPANRQCVGEPTRSRVVGKHCESGDIVIDDTWLPADLADGDLLAVAATGAYCRAMASNYNLLLRPAVVSVRDGRSEVVIRREELSDMFALDALLGSATTTQD